MPRSLIRALRLRSADSGRSLQAPGHPLHAARKELVRSPRDLTQEAAAPSVVNSPLWLTSQAALLIRRTQAVLYKEITCDQDSLLCSIMIVNCTILGPRAWPPSGLPGGHLRAGWLRPPPAPGVHPELQPAPSLPPSAGVRPPLWLKASGQQGAVARTSTWVTDVGPASQEPGRPGCTLDEFRAWTTSTYKSIQRDKLPRNKSNQGSKKPQTQG